MGAILKGEKLEIMEIRIEESKTRKGVINRTITLVDRDNVEKLPPMFCHQDVDLNKFQKGQKVQALIEVIADNFNLRPRVKALTVVG